jgi:NADPH:quinone reductase-like Zn-dependent oxidoreductase
MKAFVQEKYGSAAEVLELRDVAEPSVGDDEVLVRVHAASVNAADWHLMRGTPYIARLDIGLRGPKHDVLGCDLAGRVEAIGRNVTTIQPGDEVFGSPFGHGFGAFAESCVLASEDLLELKPSNLTFEQAAAVPLAGMTALQALRDHGRIEDGQHVLIIGASGGVGTFAVQIAKSLGAEVTGVCSARNVESVRSLGADYVIDYTQDDFADGGKRYDVILQAAGARSPADCRRALTRTGTLVAISGESAGHWIGPVGRAIRAFVLFRFASQRLAIFTVKPNNADLRTLKELIEAGEVTPMIDRTYSLTEAPQAVAYVEEGHARGKVVLSG